MDNTLYLCVGKSASGKTSVANILEKKHSLRQVNSYTTRPSRYEGEIGHVFLTEDEFDNLGELVAYTEYNSHRYGTTAEQLDQCQIYVVDPHGVKTLLERYKTNRNIIILYFEASFKNRVLRMRGRGDSDTAIISRLMQDELMDWQDQINDILWEYHNRYDNRIWKYDIYTDDSLEATVARVERIMGVDA